MKQYSIINPDQYDPTPLIQSIRKLSIPDSDFTDGELASLVAKYLVGYIQPSTVHQDISLDTINQVFEY
jgi:hypothetical protein